MAKTKSFEEFYYIKTGKNCNVKDVVDHANKVLKIHKLFTRGI